MNNKRPRLWTRRRDRELLEAIIVNPRLAIRRFARQHGIPRVEIIRHMRALGLTVLNGPLPTACKHGTPAMGASVCADCAEERAS